jgi:hypothetical protein
MRGRVLREPNINSQLVAGLVGRISLVALALAVIATILAFLAFHLGLGIAFALAAMCAGSAGKRDEGHQSNNLLHLSSFLGWLVEFGQPRPWLINLPTGTAQWEATRSSCVSS